MNGQSAATPPTAAAAPVATKRKSRRVGWSAEDAVVTIPTLSSCATGGTAPGGAQRSPEQAAGARGPPRQQNYAYLRRNERNSSPESFYWHPCPASASPLSARKRAMHEFPAGRCLLRQFRTGPTPSQPMQIALFQPDIPQNTGTILRLCACLDMAAHIIEPAGFPFSDRLFRRAGMDYLDHVSVTRHDSGRNFRTGARRKGTGSSCSPPKARPTILILAMSRRTSCCSGARPPASPTKWSRPPMRGSSSPSSPGCARSTWRWPQRWPQVKRCGRSATSGPRVLRRAW